jgi:hypothetical protein
LKELFLLIVAFFTINVADAQSLTDGLLIYYPFTGNANDASGHGYNGTVSGATLTTDRFGNANSAYDFHGTDAYIDLPNVPLLKPQLPFSISLWVYFNDLNNNYSIISTDYDESSYSGSWIGCGKDINQDTVIFISYGDGGTIGDVTARRTKSGKTKIRIKQWYLVSAVFRGPTDMDIYVNCTKDIGSYSGTGGNLSYSSSAGSIGRKRCSVILPTSYWYLNGKVDEVRFWNRELTQKDVDNLCKLSETQEGEILIYPNPAHNNITVEQPESLKLSALKIYDIYGRELIRQQIVYSKTQIDIGCLSSGIYFVKLITDTTVEIRKLIKK